MVYSIELWAVLLVYRFSPRFFTYIKSDYNPAVLLDFNIYFCIRIRAYLNRR